MVHQNQTSSIEKVDGHHQDQPGVKRQLGFILGCPCPTPSISQSCPPHTQPCLEPRPEGTAEVDDVALWQGRPLPLNEGLQGVDTWVDHPVG